MTLPKMSKNSVGSTEVLSIHENSSNLHLDILRSMEHEYRTTIISTSWIIKTRNTSKKEKNPTYLATSGNALPKSILKATTQAVEIHIIENKPER